MYVCCLRVGDIMLTHVIKEYTQNSNKIQHLYIYIFLSFFDRDGFNPHTMHEGIVKPGLVLGVGVYAGKAE